MSASRTRPFLFFSFIPCRLPNHAIKTDQTEGSRFKLEAWLGDKRLFETVFQVIAYRVRIRRMSQLMEHSHGQCKVNFGVVYVLAVFVLRYRVKACAQRNNTTMTAFTRDLFAAGLLTRFGSQIDELKLHSVRKESQLFACRLDVVEG